MVENVRWKLSLTARETRAQLGLEFARGKFLEQAVSKQGQEITQKSWDFVAESCFPPFYRKPNTPFS